MKRVFIPLVLLVAAVLGTDVVPAGAARAEQHCYVQVVDRKPSGELVTTAPSCYDSMAEMQQAASSPSTRSRRASTTSSFALDTHYDQPNLTGSSTTVYGSDCLGGWLNTSAYWAANMASTASGCNRVRHHLGTNLTGTYQDIFSPGGNLVSPWFHHVWSVQYLT